MTVPPEAITDEASPVRAAFNAMREHGRHHAEEDYTDLCCVAAALAGAIPHLDAYKRGAAAERDRLLPALARHQHKITDSKGTICAGCLSDWPCPDLQEPS